LLYKHAEVFTPTALQEANDEQKLNATASEPLQEEEKDQTIGSSVVQNMEPDKTVSETDESDFDESEESEESGFTMEDDKAEKQGKHKFDWRYGQLDQEPEAEQHPLLNKIQPGPDDNLDAIQQIEIQRYIALNSKATELAKQSWDGNDEAAKAKARDALPSYSTALVEAKDKLQRSGGWEVLRKQTAMKLASAPRSTTASGSSTALAGAAGTTPTQPEQELPATGRSAMFLSSSALEGAAGKTPVSSSTALAGAACTTPSLTSSALAGAACTTPSITISAQEVSPRSRLQALHHRCAESTVPLDRRHESAVSQECKQQ
jgi:hypothetical protein